MTTSQMQIDGARMREEAVRLRRPLTLGELQNLFGNTPEQWREGLCIPCHENGVTEDVDSMGEMKRWAHRIFHTPGAIIADGIVCVPCAGAGAFVYLPEYEGHVCPVCDAKEQAKPSGRRYDPKVIAAVGAAMVETIDEWGDDGV